MTEQQTQITGIIATAAPAPQGDPHHEPMRPWEWAVVRSGGSAVVCRLVFAAPPPATGREAA